jgi:hypothetical protein
MIRSVDIVIPLENYDGGHPAASRPALPNLINAVKMFKVKINVKTALTLTLKY